MKKKIICFIMLMFVCVVLVIPKTNAMQSSQLPRNYYSTLDFDFYRLLVNGNNYVSDFDNVFVRDNNINATYNVITSVEVDNLRFFKDYSIADNVASIEYSYCVVDDITHDISRLFLYADTIYLGNTDYFVINGYGKLQINCDYYLGDNVYSFNKYIEINGNSFNITNYIFDTLSSTHNLFTYLKLSNININFSPNINFSSDFTFIYPIIRTNSDIVDRGVLWTQHYYPSEIIVETINPDLSGWLTSGLSGFMNFEIAEGWSFGVIFALIVAIPIVLYLLKYFFGG